MTEVPTAFILANTVLTRTQFVPEIPLYLANEITPIWQASEEWLRQRNIEPPFWAFAWPGSLALARHILDNPVTVAGRRILDFAAGCGLAAIACARAGAAFVEAAEIDPFAIAAIELNAETNGVAIAMSHVDIVGSACRWDTIICGDVCYEVPMTDHIMPWLERMSRQCDVWIADPGRRYLPSIGLRPLARYRVPTSLELEDRLEREVVLYQLSK